MIKLNTPKGYALAVGVVLLGFGIFGFAFRGVIDVPTKYLFVSLGLGVWGITVGRQNN